MNKEDVLQDLKELDATFDYLVKMDGVKDSGHRWIEFSDKWEAFKKRLISKLPASAPVQEDKCAHVIVDARNEVIKSGYMCIKCKAIFKAHEHQKPTDERELLLGFARHFNSLDDITIKEKNIDDYLPETKNELTHVQEDKQDELWDELIIEYNQLNMMEENTWEWNREILKESYTITKKQ